MEYMMYRYKGETMYNEPPSNRTVVDAPAIEIKPQVLHLEN